MAFKPDAESEVYEARPFLSLRPERDNSFLRKRQHKSHNRPILVLLELAEAIWSSRLNSLAPPLDYTRRALPALNDCATCYVGTEDLGWYGPLFVCVGAPGCVSKVSEHFLPIIDTSRTHSD